MWNISPGRTPNIIIYRVWEKYFLEVAEAIDKWLKNGLPSCFGNRRIHLWGLCVNDVDLNKFSLEIMSLHQKMEKMWQTFNFRTLKNSQKFHVTSLSNNFDILFYYKDFPCLTWVRALKSTMAIKYLGLNSSFSVVEHVEECKI
jgi:hypothetical protein